MQRIRIIFSGEGGQGIQTISKVFVTAASKQGFEVSYLPSFGVEQRGTPSVAFITIDNKEIRHPKFDKADIVVILGKRAIKTVENYLDPNTELYFDSSTISKGDLPIFVSKIHGVPATKYAKEKFALRSFNLIVLGVIAKAIGIKEELIWEEIFNFLSKKFKKKEDENLAHEAFLFGLEIVPETEDFTRAIFKAKHQAILVKGHGKHGTILPDKCKGCGICIHKCPVGALSLGEDLGVFSTPIPQVDLEKCIGCQNCKNFCPDGAITMEMDASA